MKRLISVVLMMALAAPVSAKTLIVANTGKAADPAYGPGEIVVRQQYLHVLTRMLDKFGVEYVVAPPPSVRTEFCRTGQMVWDYGTSSARTEQFDAVIHLMATRRSTGADYFTTYNPESLSTVTKMPTVPQLFVVSGAAAFAISVLFPQYIINSAGSGSTSACSLGMAAYLSAGDMTHEEEGVMYSPHHEERWSGAEFSDHGVVSAASLVGKGYRKLLAFGSGPLGLMGYVANSSLPMNPDSLLLTAPEGDTLNLWMVANTHYSGAKPNIVCTVGEVIGDGAGGLIYPSAAFDNAVMLAALAVLDSASSGKVFNNKRALPYKMALTVDGLCSRSIRTNSGGIVPSDTARFYATIDSLAAYRIPFVFGVNLDSVSTYPRDLQYAMANAPLARFSPQTRAGIDSGAAGNGVAHRYRPTDTFRRYRNIQMAVGPTTGNPADTSLSALLSYSLSLQDSLTPGRVSRFALPVDDDWSPYNLRGHQADMSRGATVDSVLYAYYVAGFRGIRINGAWHVGRPNKNPSNPRGYIPQEGKQRVYGGGRVVLLAHPGGATFGTRFNSWNGATSDSVAPFSTDPPPGNEWYLSRRLWHGMAPRINETYANAYDLDENFLAADVHEARVLKVSCQELAGPEVNSMANPNAMQRPSWWAIRKLAMPMALMNKFAGRTIMQFAYPEDIKP